MSCNDIAQKWRWKLTLALFLLSFLCFLIGPWEDFTSLAEWQLVFRLRFPRLLGALLVGAGLSVSGAVLQHLFQNPLAEPFTLGISGGALFGVALGLWLQEVGLLSPLLLPALGFLGGLAATWIVQRLGFSTSYSPYRLVLGGVVTSFVFTTAVFLLLYFYPPSLAQGALFFLMGDLGGLYWPQLLACGLFIVFGILRLYRISEYLDLLALGEEKAFSLGIDPHHFLRQAFFLSSLVAGASVALGGLIGFLGIVVPHIFRSRSIASLPQLLPLAALGGAMGLLVLDTAARTVAYPLELPVGLLCGFFGGLFLLFLLQRQETL